jgi:formate hydrogenlyase transcriptional activator
MSASYQASGGGLDFRLLFDSVPGLYLVLAPDLTIVAANDAYLRATMTRREEIVGKNIFDAFPDNPNDAEATGVRNLRASLDRVLRDKRPDAMPIQKYDIRTPESAGGGFEERYWSPLNLPILGENGEVLQIIHRVEDVTDFVRMKQKQAKHEEAAGELRARAEELEAEIFLRSREVKERTEALSRTEQRFRAMVQAVRDYAIFLLDPEGRVLTWNPGAERIKGYTNEEVLGKSFSLFYTPADRADGKPEAALRIAASTGRHEDEGWRVRKDGSQFWASVVLTAIRDERGALASFAKITRDLTEVREAQEAIRRSEAQFRALFEYSPDAIVVTDGAGRIAAMNSRVESVFGYTRSELLGQPVETLVPERFRGTHPHHRGEYVRTARARPMGAGLELYGLRKDGSEFPADIMLGPAETANGRVVLSVIRDLTEKREAEEALRQSELQKRYLEEELNTEAQFEEVIGESVGLKRVLKMAETVAATDTTVLILGETGTGKEVIARAIHQHSPRREHVMVKLNCAAIPTGLLESELFGHERGAFTGALERKIGRLELAHQGTLFLDEIGDLPLELQPKILRALQEKEFERLGSAKPIPVNVRLIAATNRDLAKMVADGRFRSDLYYRLRVFPILLPPLRERREDIPLLVRYFVDRHARTLDKKIESIPDDVMRALTRWTWPGNIRELENFIERAVILSKGPALRIPFGELEMPDASDAEEDVSLETADREHILRVLRETKGKIGGSDGAAARLGLVRTTLNSKIKKLGLKREDYL